MRTGTFKYFTYNFPSLWRAYVFILLQERLVSHCIWKNKMPQIKYYQKIRRARCIYDEMIRSLHFFLTCKRCTSLSMTLIVVWKHFCSSLQQCAPFFVKSNALIDATLLTCLCWVSFLIFIPTDLARDFFVSVFSPYFHSYFY